MVLFNSSKAQETSFLTLDFLSLYNGKPLKHLQNTKTIKKSCAFRFRLLQKAGKIMAVGWLYPTVKILFRGGQRDRKIASQIFAMSDQGFHIKMRFCDCAMEGFNGQNLYNQQNMTFFDLQREKAFFYMNGGGIVRWARRGRSRLWKV